MDKYDVAIVGGGPGGLSCAAELAGRGVKVVLLERKRTIGHKVCAGGITWHGLIGRVPETLLQESFPRQYIFSNWQKICLRRDEPIIATVNREDLGRWMMENAQEKGATIIPGCSVTHIGDHSLQAVGPDRKPWSIDFDHLVGADGSSSMVRRHLGIPSRRMGVGINYQVPGRYKMMEWHLQTRHFHSGYGWIFPHRDTLSIGAYAPAATLKPARLQSGLLQWARTRGFDLRKNRARAECINYDYQGFHFDRTWLVGDAAGLASGLTGEGIHPAILSGEEVARKIIDPAHRPEAIEQMVRKKKGHERIVSLASRGSFSCTLLMETLTLLLRSSLVDFQKELSM